MHNIQARLVLLINKRMVARRILGTEILPKIDEDDIARHDRGDDQSERDEEPVYADAIDPRLLGKDKDGGDGIANEHHCH